ncbi:MAG: cysteine desulfurase NifS, partial [Armatimonadetes bacterium]|nr:cysteine desulfurase NifS [Armatimonadota bacterium]
MRRGRAMIYLDHSATTKTDPEVLEAMLPYLQDQFGNPSSVYTFAGESRAALDRAREQVAALINADPREIIFTGGGSEADNLAIKGYAWAHQDRGKHIITSAVEHHAVLHACDRLAKMGFEVTTLCVDQYGLVDPQQVADAMRDDTLLVTIMHANNEVGTIQPVEEIAALCRERKVAFHTDAVQSLGRLPLDVKAVGADMMAFSAHKIYGPKGVGVLYLKKGTRVWPVIDGGAQERGLRSGTENVAGIVGMGQACELLSERMDEDNARILALRERLRQGITDRIEYLLYTGHPERRLPNIASFCFRYIEGEGILLSLDAYDICASSGSACTSGSLDPSHCLLAMGLPHAIAHGSLRLSLGRENTEAEMDRVIEVLPGII